MQKSVQQKVRQCKEVIIQGMEKTLQHKMVYMYIKQRKKEADIKQFSVNGKDGIIKIEFIDHQKARLFYDEANFVEKILIRPFNIYFNLTLSEAEMKKFYLEGITQENQRKLFLECRKIGFCKLYTSYAAGARGKLKPTGVLSFNRKQDLSQADFKFLSENLKALGIKIYPYIHDKGPKCSINLLNFYEGDLNQEETVIQEAAQKQVRQLINEITKEPQTSLSVVVKKKQAIGDKIPARVLVTAILEYADVQKTMKIFQQIRSCLVDRGQAKAVLYFHNEQNNSYLSLFTPGLAKPKDMTEKQFENKLLHDFKKINPNVLQVNIFAVAYNDTYIGRVYLKTEQDGKDFIVDYSSKRGEIFQNYKQKAAPIIFNINIDGKTLRKIKLAERKAKEMEDNLKKHTQVNRRDNRPLNNYPIKNLPIPGIMPNISINPNMPINPNLMPLLPQGNPMMPMPGMQMNLPPYPQGLNNKINPQNLGPPPLTGNRVQIDMKSKIKNILRQRQNFEEEMELQKAKRYLFDAVRYSLEEIGVAPPESGPLADIIVKQAQSASILIHYLESQEDLKKKVLSIKH